MRLPSRSRIALATTAAAKASRAQTAPPTSLASRTVPSAQSAAHKAGAWRSPWALAGFGLLLALAAWLLPPLQQAAGYHGFADQRSLAGLSHAADVLSNLAFALAAVLGAWWLRGVDRSQVPATARWLVAWFLLGLVCTTLGSSYYHLVPDDARLVWDRLGMSVAFAGLLGLAVQGRLGDASAWATALVVALAAPLSVWFWQATGNLLPWALVQGGGMLLLVALACMHQRHASLPVAWAAVVGLYALSKLLELSDWDIYLASGQGISGHSLKHLCAAAAAWPVLHALRVRQRR